MMIQEVYMHFGISFGFLAIMLVVLVITCIKTEATDRPELREGKQGGEE